METKNHKTIGAVTISDTMLMTPSRYIPLKNIHGMSLGSTYEEYKEVYDYEKMEKKFGKEPPLALTEKEFYKTLKRKLPFWLLNARTSTFYIGTIPLIGLTILAIAIKPILSIPLFVLVLLLFFAAITLKVEYKAFFKQFEEHYKQRCEARRLWETELRLNFAEKVVTKPAEKVLTLYLKDYTTNSYSLSSAEDSDILLQIKQTIEEKIMNLA